MNKGVKFSDHNLETDEASKRRTVKTTNYSLKLI